MSEVVTVKVGGAEFVNWKSATISLGLESAARSFSLSVTHPRADADSPVEFKTGQSCEIFIGEGRAREKVLTGRVDSFAPSYDATSQTVGLAGRSKTRAIVDCSNIAPRRQNKRTIPQIVKALCDPYGVTARFDVDPADPVMTETIKRFTVEPDEKVFAAIERLARLRSLLITDDADGRLVLVVGAPGRFPLQLGAKVERGVNVLAGDGNFDASELYGEYRVKGQRAGDDDESGAVVAGIEAISTDDGIDETRVLIMTSESALTRAQAQAHADWAAANRLGRSTLIAYTVRGWRDDLGTLWTPGTLVEVVDGFMRVNAALLVVNVDFVVNSEEGHVAKLTLAPEGGYYAKLPSNARHGLGAWGAA